MPPAPAKATPRPYLASAARRVQLLDAAGRLVREGGWRALSIKGLAAAAGVSRQLVYEHFPTVDDVAVATLMHLFERTYARTQAIVQAGRPIEETIREALAQFLDLPREERHALRSLAIETDPSRRGLARAQARLRSRITQVWAPYLQQLTRVDEAHAAALAWTFTTACWGLSDAVTDGTLTRAQALDLFARLVNATLKEMLS